MIIMTDGLRSLAGDTMRYALMRFTRSPLSGAITGAASTTVLQSSSATTVAAVGFVGAGLLSFSEALGIIFGANIGTTITGWLVVLLGFKLKIGVLLLPLILIGSILRLFGRGRLATAGLAIAGFGLIFVGISLMQQGMAELHDIVTPASFPDDTFIGRLQLLLLGIAITIVTQSSSAGVATTLTALFAGAIDFNQAAVLVIGMDIGTTTTAAIASIGGSVGSRRTGLSHVIYNVLTGIGALILLTPYTLLWESIAPGQLVNNAEVALVAFHSSFNILGVLVILPFTNQFARLIKHLIKGGHATYTQELDKALLSEPQVALTAALSSLQKEFLDLLSYTRTLLTSEELKRPINLNELQLALNETHAYVDLINLDKSIHPEWPTLLAVIHSLDHLQRLHERCEEDRDRAYSARNTKELSAAIDTLVSIIADLSKIVRDKDLENYSSDIENRIQTIFDELEPVRDSIMSRVADSQINVPTATDMTEAVRWLKRVSWHISRIAYHLDRANT